MTLSTYRFIALLVAGLATALIFADGLNQLFGSQGTYAPIMIDLSSATRETMGWIAIGATIVAIAMAALDGRLATLAGVAISALLTATLFEPMLSNLQVTFAWTAFLMSLLGIARVYVTKRLGSAQKRKPTVDDHPLIGDGEMFSVQ